MLLSKAVAKRPKTLDLYAVLDWDAVLEFATVK
jgi:hypothetical protein